MVDNQELPSKEFEERIAKALTMHMESDCPPFSQLPPQYYPAKAVYNASPDDMAQLIRDLQKQLTATQQALNEANADLAASEISYKEWVAKHAEMYAKNQSTQQALDSAVEEYSKLKVFRDKDRMEVERLTKVILHLNRFLNEEASQF